MVGIEPSCSGQETAAISHGFVGKGVGTQAQQIDPLSEVDHKLSFQHSGETMKTRFKKMTATVSAIGVLTMVCAMTSAAAEQRATTGTGIMQSQGSRDMGLQGTQSKVRASELLNMRVTSPNGAMGKVQDVVLSADGHSVDYVAISLSGATAGQQIAVPLKQLSLSPDGRSLTLAAAESAQRFSVEQQPGLGSQWGQAASRNAAGTTRLTQLIGRDVRGANGESVGSIRDMVIDLNQGSVVTAAISTGGTMGIGTKLVSVNWRQLQLSADKGYATVNQSRESLQRTATGEQEYWQRFGFEGQGQPGNAGRTPSQSGIGTGSSQQQNQPGTGTGLQNQRNTGSGSSQQPKQSGGTIGTP
jgi:sporulation protein YlmC with PRC-barrel domain